MEDFEVIYETDNILGDYLKCKHCGETFKLKYMSETQQLKSAAFEMAIKSLYCSSPIATPTPDDIRAEAEKIYQWLLKP
jgi:transposase-like protein